MVTENGMVMMSYAEYKGMKAAEDKLAELLISNEMLRKAMLQLTNKGNKTDIRVSRSDFVKMYDMTTSEIFKTNI